MDLILTCHIFLFKNWVRITWPQIPRLYNCECLCSTTKFVSTDINNSEDLLCLRKKKKNNSEDLLWMARKDHCYAWTKPTWPTIFALVFYYLSLTLKTNFTLQWSTIITLKRATLVPLWVGVDFHVTQFYLWQLCAVYGRQRFTRPGIF